MSLLCTDKAKYNNVHTTYLLHPCLLKLIHTFILHAPLTNHFVTGFTIAYYYFEHFGIAFHYMTPSENLNYLSWNFQSHFAVHVKMKCSMLPFPPTIQDNETNSFLVLPRNAMNHDYIVLQTYGCGVGVTTLQTYLSRKRICNFVLETNHFDRTQLYYFTRMGRFFTAFADQ